MRTGWTALLVGASLLVGLPAAALAQTDPIVGVWTLNHDLTPAPAGPDVRRGENTRGTGGRRGMGRGGGMGRDGGGAQPSDEDRLRIEAVMRRLRDVPERLTITRDGAVVAFATAEGRAWSVQTDGETTTRLTGDGEIVSKARAEGHDLVVEEAVKSSPTLVFTYVPFDDQGRRRLKVLVRLEGGGRRAGPAPEVTRIYDGEP